MHRTHQNRGDANLFWGLLLLAGGTLILLKNLRVIDIDFRLGEWWPIVLIVIGLKHLLVLRGSAAWISGLFWIGTGGLFLSGTLGYLNTAIPTLIWPILVIWFGVLIAIGPAGHGKSHGSRP